ncbi:MAG: transpeptidase family protein [Bacteroidales bacterium]|nr:transpeptidase family protein [Bacteroidales bacterium]
MTEDKNDILWRVYLIYGFMLLFGVAVIGKIVFIQVKEGPELTKEAAKQEIRIFDLEASRGNILSDEGDLLATSVPVFEVRMDVGSEYISKELFNSKVDSLSRCLANLFQDQSANTYRRMLVEGRKKGNRFLLIHRRVTYDQLKKIETFPILRRKAYGGLITFQKTTRELPYGMLAARTIGYDIPEEHISVGLEGAFAKVLRGKDGKQLRRRINHGAWLPVHNDMEVDPHNGEDLVTTINVDLQDVAEEALRKQMIKHEARMGCAVLMSVKTGDIKAIANLKYDSTDGRYEENYNMAIGEKLEPGSTFKLASMIAVLDDHKVTLTDTVSVGKGAVNYYGRVLRDVHDVGHGILTVEEAFERSSNVGISKIIYRSYKDDPSKFIDHLYALKLNKPLGLPIPGEAMPYIKNPSDKKVWYLTSLPWMSVGYGLELTPLQILTLYNAVANDGVEVKPRFVSAITEGGNVIKKFPVVIRDSMIAPPRVIQQVKKLLVGVVENGTGQILKNKHFKIAGKTGTAKIAKNGTYISEYNATFVGYFPADDPQYSCIVVINRPKNGYYGASAAAPVFKEIADEVYATSLAINMGSGIPDTLSALPLADHPVWYPDLKTIYKSLGINQKDYLSEEKWAETKDENDTAVFNVKDFSNGLVPNVRGMKARDAIYLLENMGFNVDVNGRGAVISQSLRPGTRFQKGQTINILLSTF